MGRRVSLLMWCVLHEGKPDFTPYRRLSMLLFYDQKLLGMFSDLLSGYSGIC